MKKIVKYNGQMTSFIVVGQRAVVYPINHPDCSNQKFVSTSPVQHIDANGTFETMNSVYVPNTLDN